MPLPEDRPGAAVRLARRFAWRGGSGGAEVRLARRFAWRGGSPGAAVRLARRFAWRSGSGGAEVRPVRCLAYTREMMQSLPDDWRAALTPAVTDAALAKLDEFVFVERAQFQVFPSDDEIFAAFALTPLAQVRAVILGQDPYYRPGQAQGLAFSVRAGVTRPRSLVNVIAELEKDLGHAVPPGATLEPWARHGVLLLNTALTVREGQPDSHRKQWKAFTAAVVALLAAQPNPIVFLLWGEHAKAAGQKIDRARHIVVKSAHPSPLSARGFVGSAPFRRANAELAKRGLPPIDWELA